MEYDHVFDKRAQSYISALKKYPHALDKEFNCALDICDLKDGDVFLTIPSSCENIYISNRTIQHIRLETSKALSMLTDIPYCRFDAIPCEDASINVVLCLATLHHSTDEERRAFYMEVLRILKPGGRIVIGDVRMYSKQDIWLNTFVNAHNSYGHAGRFFTEADTTLLENAGFTTSVLEKHYTWDFSTKHDMVAFCKELFHLDRASHDNVEKGLATILNARETSFDWELLYLVGSKP
jgi:SAM-dependent methyltransferase